MEYDQLAMARRRSFLGLLRIDRAARLRRKDESRSTTGYAGVASPVSLSVYPERVRVEKNAAYEQVIKIMSWFGLLLIGIAALSSCAALRGPVVSVLNAAQIACIMRSEVTDDKALADACDVAKDLLPIVRRLVGQREAARRAGVKW